MVGTGHNLKKLGFEARFVPGACGFSYYTREANESFPSKRTNGKGRVEKPGGQAALDPSLEVAAHCRICACSCDLTGCWQTDFTAPPSCSEVP